MYVYLSKILPLFVMPLGLVLLLSLVALILLRYRKRRWASLIVFLSFAILWIASMPVVADRLYRQIESSYPPVALADVPVGGCIVLLGGVVAAPLPPRLDLEMSDAVDRVYKAAQLHREGKGKMLIVSAGNQPWSQSPWDEADIVRELLIEWGVPEEAILLEGSSRNTRENALYSKNIIDSINCENPLLVTSAAHMLRAVASFQSLGVRVFPVSTDVKAVDNSQLAPASFLPNAGALAMTSSAIREWIGQKAYRMQGWN